MINLNNYEIWMMDYYDGNLSATDSDLLRAFLVEHPELEEVLDEMALPILTPDHVSFDNKDGLYISLSDDDLQIAKLEGDLSDADTLKHATQLDEISEELYKKTILVSGIDTFDKSSLYTDQYNDVDIDDLIQSKMDGTISSAQQLWLNKHLSDDFITKQIAMFNSSKAVPDLSVVFPNKESLKKRPVVMLYLRRAIAVAAMLAIVFLSRNMMQTDDNLRVNQTFAQHQNKANDVNKTFQKSQSNPTPEVAVNIELDSPSDAIFQEVDNTLSKNSNRILNTKDQGTSIDPTNKINQRKGKELVAVMDEMPSRLNQSEILLNEAKTKNNKVIIPQSISNIGYKDLAWTNTAKQYIIDPSLIEEASYGSDIHPMSSQSKFASDIRVEIPSVFYRLASVVSSAQDAYALGKNNNRKVYNLKLGPISFYRSSEQ